MTRLVRALRARRNPARARAVQRYFKHTVAALGLDTPTVRALVRAELTAVKGAWTAAEAVAAAARLLREPELEPRGAGLLLLAGFQPRLTPAFLPRAEAWLATRLDNWALVDTFCSAVLSPLLGRHPEVEPVLRRWSRADGLWLRRAALVTLVPLARRGRFLDAAYTLAAGHFADPEDLMHKATGWLLREAGRTDLPRLRAFLLRHGPAIPRTALRYAIERFPARAQGRLLAATRPAAARRATPSR